MQKKCQRLAKKFNEYDVPRKIAYNDLCVIELVDRPVDASGGAIVSPHSLVSLFGGRMWFAGCLSLFDRRPELLRPVSTACVPFGHEKATRQ